MAETFTPPEFHLHFEGKAAAGHTVPASALVQAVQGLQRAIYLLAASHEGYDFKQRLRVSHELERKYAVIFKVPEDGGYDIPYSIGGAAERFFDTDDVAIVTTQYEATLDAVKSNDHAALKRILPFAPIRKQYLGALKNIQPPARSGIVVSLEDARRNKLLDGKIATSILTPLLRESDVPKVQPRLITGRLDILDFQARSLTLQLFSGRRLTCNYAEDFEPILLENAREWIQVRGEAVLGDGDRLEALNNVDEIIEVNDADVIVESVNFDGITLNATESLAFPVHFDPDGGLYTVDGAFNIITAGETRAEIELAIVESVEFLWNEYVKSPAELLSADAVELRNELLRCFSEVDHAV